MFTGHSKRFAGEIRNRLSSVISTGGKDKEAPLIITSGLFMPVVLVEILYLSNQKDLDMLSKPDFINNVATSLSDSILAFNRVVSAQKASSENN
jgi:N-acetylmuramoyl-L-alanine amidase